MKKLAIYPYHKQNCPIARYKHLLEGYELTSIITAKGWGGNGQDASFFDGGVSVGIGMTDTFEEGIKDSDAVLFLEPLSDKLLSTYPAKFGIVKRYDKEIIITTQVEEKLLLLGVERNELLNYTVLNPDRKVNFEVLLHEQADGKLAKIDIPILLVLGMGENCNKFELQLSARNYFLKKGYKVSQLGTKNFSPLFGFSALPGFLYAKDIFVQDKIIAFNHYVQQIAITEKPDVIIIGAPGGIIPINNNNTNHFGLIPYMISNAVKTDITILSTYFNYYNVEVLNEFRKCCKYRFNCITDYINIANTRYMLNPENVDQSVDYMSLTSEYVLEQLPSISTKEFHLFNILNDPDAEFIFERICSELEGNIVAI
ncbi:peptide maturation system protein (TIGR04066 family) [Paenibacillus turicensis]|uniref:Peptide maturation system protein (TIGR04066 family) n=1 Tax=Paenibacillus turicensis TaxID=160487 RepID=A0ABS4FNU4_9BACL|nr:TIGR04066 family peptide maturation system protein [Paenibacillus turicensis]MBP1904018.1 peptide maturation system protein (TIGR04066 family) [Paenibacillus turicensis]